MTGGAGFVGSHLCDVLMGQGHSVICVDNFYTGTRANVAHLLGNPKFELREHDIVNPIDAEVDEIYNLACPASPIYYQKDPVQTTKTAVIGTMNMLDLAEANGARILQASTSEIYGDPEVHPQTEDYWGNVNPLGPRACYDEGKRCGETLCIGYRDTRGVNVKIARLFNIYGPRMQLNDGRVISNFVTQALRGEDITVYGGGTQTRSFCFVSDLVDGLVRLMNSRDGFTGPVNLGNPYEMEIRDLAEKVIAATRSTSRLIFPPLPVDDPTRRKPDITLAKQELGWDPTVSLEEGLESSITYFREALGLEPSAGAADQLVSGR
ncbi:MAG: UDP-glucuronic acid decarboxylase family protein [Marinibacterium sp.]